MLESLFLTVLKMSLFASVLAAAVIVFRAVFQKHVPKALMLCLWAVVFIRLLIPFTIPSPVSLFNRVETKPVESLVQSETVRPEAAASPAVSAAIPDDTGNSAAAAGQADSFSVLTAAAFVWAAGSAMMAVLLLLLYTLSRHRLQAAAFLTDEQCSSFKAMAESPHIRYGVLSGIASPMATGILHPTILLPENPARYEKDELLFILTHERHHIRRHDTLWNLFMLMAVSIHWFNPLVWISYRLSSKDIELSCDESVINRFGENIRSAYANAILRFAQNRNPSKTSFFVMGFGQSFIRKRVLSIMNYKKVKIASIVLAIVLASTVTVVFGTGAMQNKIPVSNSSVGSPTDETNENQNLFESPTSSDLVEDTAPLNSFGTSPSDITDAANTSAGVQPSVTVGSTTLSSSQPLTSGTTAFHAVEPQSVIIVGNCNGYALNDGDCFAGTAQLTAVITPKNAQDKSVTWSSDNPDQISVDQNGKIESHILGGSATITVTTKNGLTAEFDARSFGGVCIPDHFKLIITGIYNGQELKDGGSFEGSAKLTASREKCITELQGGHWSSDNPEAIAVDQNGVLTALKSGCTATITASVDDKNEPSEYNSAQFRVFVP